MKPTTISLRRGERAIATILFGLGAYLVVSSLSMPAGSFSLPGPGFFPRIIGALLAVASVIAFLRAGPKRAGRGQMLEVGHREVVLMIVILGLAAGAFVTLGAWASIAMVGSLGLRVLGKATWSKAVFFGLVAATTGWLIFARLLGLQLPAMPWT